jgi:hypothetical protein
MVPSLRRMFISEHFTSVIKSFCFELTDHKPSDILNIKSRENLALFQNRLRHKKVTVGLLEVSITYRMPRTQTTEYFMSAWRGKK